MIATLFLDCFFKWIFFFRMRTKLPVSPSPYAAIESASSTSSSGLMRFDPTD